MVMTMLSPLGSPSNYYDHMRRTQEDFGKYDKMCQQCAVRAQQINNLIQEKASLEQHVHVQQLEARQLQQQRDILQLRNQELTTRVLTLETEDGRHREEKARMRKIIHGLAKRVAAMEVCNASVDGGGTRSIPKYVDMAMEDDLLEAEEFGVDVAAEMLSKETIQAATEMKAEREKIRENVNIEHGEDVCEREQREAEEREREERREREKELKKQREEREREEREKEARAREEKERYEREEREKEQYEREQRERYEKERREKEEREQKEKEARAREENERYEREEREKEQYEREQREKEEKYQREKEEKYQREKEEREQLLQQQHNNDQSQQVKPRLSMVRAESEGQTPPPTTTASSNNNNSNKTRVSNIRAQTETKKKPIPEPVDVNNDDIDIDEDGLLGPLPPWNKNNTKQEIAGKKEEQEEEEEEESPIVSHSKRDRKKRGGVSAAASSQLDHNDTPFEIKAFPKDSQLSSWLTDRMKNSVLFQHLDSEQMMKLVDAFFPVDTAEGHVLIKQGDSGDNFYVLYEGLCEIFVRTRDTPPDQFGKKVFVAKSGNSFGELSLLYNAPRAATVVCQGPCKLFALDRSTFSYIMRTTETDKRSLYCGFLEKVQLFAALDKEEVAKIADVLCSKVFDDGDYIIRQGDEGDYFYIVAEGSAVAIKDGKEVMEMHKGNYFGERALITNEPRAASVVAKDRCKVLSLDKASFTRLLGPCEDIMHRRIKTY